MKLCYLPLFNIQYHNYFIINRDLYPTLLRKTDRGKLHNPKALPAEYGKQKVPEAVDGVDLLEAYEKGDIAINSDGNLINNNILKYRYY